MYVRMCVCTYVCMCVCDNYIDLVSRSNIGFSFWEVSCFGGPISIEKMQSLDE